MHYAASRHAGVALLTTVPIWAGGLSCVEHSSGGYRFLHGAERSSVLMSKLFGVAMAGWIV